MTDLVSFLLARIDEDEQWAIESSRRGDWLVEGGAHWRWGVGENWDTDPLDAGQNEYVGGDGSATLISVEEAVSNIPDMPIPLVALRADDVHTAVAGHIARHDPARVLAECAAKRSIVAAYQHLMKHGDDESHEARAAVRALGTVYADHPDYDESWRP